MQRYQFAIVEWLWDQHVIRVNLPEQPEKLTSGSYDAVVGLLTDLGSEGWDVATTSGSANWLLWTLRRAYWDDGQGRAASGS